MYVIQADGGPVKIGVATDPQKRLAALRTGTPFRLSLAHVEAIDDDLRAVNVERAAHALLSAAHTHGEWFNVTVEEATAAVQRAIVDLRRQPRPMPITRAAHDHGALTTAEQIRAARALIRWEQSALAERAGVSVETIKRLERMDGPLMSTKSATLHALEEAFRAAGVVFTNGGEPGVKLMRKTE